MKGVLITGAAGFIGSHVCRYFCKRGIPTRCYIKASSPDTYIQNLPIETIHGDITDLKTLSHAMKGIHTVIHVAALTKDWGSYSGFYASNVTGTLNVLLAGEMAGVKQYILTGSISSYGEENSTQVKDETYPYKAHYPYFTDSLFPCKMNYYRDTKALGTQKAVEYARQKHLSVTILEPAWVYGEREFNTCFYTYLKTIKNKVPFFPGSKKNKLHVVYIQDLARAYYLTYLKELKGVQRIIIGNRKSDLMQNILSIFCHEIGINKPGNLPKCLCYPLAYTLEWLYSISRQNAPPLLTRGRVNMFYDNIEYSTTKAQHLLSFTNQYELEDGIRRTVRWYRQQHLI
jgi:nucleoside-diphosphate-sugar epimerase